MRKGTAIVERVNKMAESSSMPDPNLGEGSGDVLGGEALETHGNSGLVGVVRDLIGTTWSPLSEFKGSDDGGVHRVIEGRTLVREAVFSGGITESLPWPDSSIGEPSPHGAEPNGATALNVALKMKAVRALVLGLVGVGTLFQLNHGI